MHFELILLITGLALLQQFMPFRISEKPIFSRFHLLTPIAPDPVLVHPADHSVEGGSEVARRDEEIMSEENAGDQIDGVVPPEKDHHEQLERHRRHTEVEPI